MMTWRTSSGHRCTGCACLRRGLLLALAAGATKLLRSIEVSGTNGLWRAEEDTLRGQLIKLGLYTIAASFATEADRAAKDERPYAAYLARLLELEKVPDDDQN